MKCEECCHAEMCKWIDELEGRGCDFLSQEPRDDAIDREYLFKVLDDFCGHDRTATITLDTLADLVYDMPSVTQKSGKWIGIDEEPHEDYECSCCGYVVSTFTANIEPHTEYKYCPNCGAKMEREVKE